SDPSDEEYAASNLSDMTEVNADDCAKYNTLLIRIPIDSEDVYQEFSSEEYAEFMHMLTQFHIQDPLTNAFIKFFNKYSNHNDHPLPSTLQAVLVFIENLNLPNFAFIIADWPKACMMCGVYGSPNSLHPCHFCLVECNMMNDVHIAKEDIHIYNENDIKNALRYDKDKEISVYNIRNTL
ncbi:15510_t:CDS:2, partial [Funneliformis caledonium]